nr:hypothetical protein [Tanacetum cinerariifolium]
MGKRAPEKNRCLTVNLHHDGVFSVSPFEYSLGDEKQIIDIHFEGMSYVEFREVIVKLVHGPVITLYYCKVGTSMKLGIKIIKTDSDVDEFVNFCYQNKWQVNLYVEHSGYDALDIRDQKETMTDDGNESSDAYFSSDEDDLSYVDFHTEVDHNVIIKNVTTNDPFLNKLCPDSAHFLNVVDEPVFANDETMEEDSENIDPKFNVKNDWRKLLVYCGRDVEVGRCAGNYNLGSLVTYRWIAHHYAKQLIADLFIPTLKMKTDIREKFFINVSLGQWSACRLDDEEIEFGHYYFRRIYVCFKGVKEGWLAGCRKVIGLDGYFLKHTCRRELLVAMGMDANNQMYPIAWAVVKVENNENWCWFISFIQEDLHLETGEGLTIISDSHKRLVEMNRVVRNWDHSITPSIRKRLELLKIAQRDWMVIPSGFGELEVRKGHESYGVNIHLRKCHNKSSYKKELVPKPPKVHRPPAARTVYGTHASARVKGRGLRGGRGAFRGRGKGSENMSENNTTEMSQRGRGRGQRGRGSGERGRGKGERGRGRSHRGRGRGLYLKDQTQKSVAANMSNRGEIGFRLGDYEAEELEKQVAEPIVAVTPSAEPIASATHSTDKGKQVVEPQGKKKGSERKAPASSEIFGAAFHNSLTLVKALVKVKATVKIAIV